MGAENELSYRGSPLLLTGKTSLTDICKTASVTVSLLSFPGHIIPLLDQEPGTEEEGGQVKCLGGKWNLWGGAGAGGTEEKVWDSGYGSVLVYN